MQQYSQPTGDKIPKHREQDSQPVGNLHPNKQAHTPNRDSLRTGQAASLAVEISGTVLSESKSSTYQDSAN